MADGTTNSPSFGIRFQFSFPGELNVAENSYMAGQSHTENVALTLLSAQLRVAPTGASVIITFYRGTKATGVVGAAIGTVTIVDGAFAAQTAVATTLLTTEFIVAFITQIGSTLPGESASMFAFGH